jgi:predicted ferric reductase
MHKVGQYYFVNFPALSLTEWHPFSVSSGPREDFVELHIRALGDHTREIVNLAKERGHSSTQTFIRIDGPYGNQNFDYMRYLCMCNACSNWH